MTTAIKIVLILSIILFTSLAYAGPLQDEVCKVAPGYVGIRENWGDNKGKEVNKILANVGLAPGNPWCMALVYTIYKDASANLGIANPVPKTGLSSGYWVYAAKHKLTFKTITNKQVLLGEPLPSGAAGIFRRGIVKGDGTFKGHADIIMWQIDKKSFKGIDGNTGSDDKGDQGEGDGSFWKVRKLGLTSFPFVGGIVVR